MSLMKTISGYDLGFCREAKQRPRPDDYPVIFLDDH